MKKVVIIAVICVLSLSAVMLCACAPEKPEDLVERLEEKFYSVEILKAEDIKMSGIDLKFECGLILTRDNRARLVAVWCFDAEDADTMKRMMKMFVKHQVLEGLGGSLPFASEDEEMVIDNWGRIFYIGTAEAAKDFLG